MLPTHSSFTVPKKLSIAALSQQLPLRDMLRLIYPTAPQLELMKTFPNRSWYRIYDRAKELNLRRIIPHNGPHKVNVYHRTVRYDDLEAVSHLIEGEEDKERIRDLANELAKNTLRGNLTAHWWLPLTSVSYVDAGKTLEPNEDLSNLSEVPCGSRHLA